VDVLISAPQKGWSSSPCCAMVMLSARAREAIEHTQSSSFSCDLKKWMQIAEGYEKGQHAYHTTMPTDALLRLRDVMLETREYGFAKVREEQMELGARCASCCSRAAFPAWRPRATRRLAWSSATPPTRKSRAAAPSQGGPADRLGRSAAMR
jgi:aspartate aminotransferase-like enzyme